MSEIELLKAFQENRSEDAFAQLVRRYAGLVYSVAKRRLANAALAEDITQVVFIRLARTPPKVGSHAELAAWLHRTTLNVTIDAWRSEFRRRTREQEAINMEITIPETTVWENISPNLDEALNQLNDADRQTILLRFFGGKTMREVGIATGVSEDAAKMRVSRAVERLRAQLGVRGAVCTAVVLGAMMAEYSVEAAPGDLVATLAAIKLPAATGMAGVFPRISKLKLAAGAIGLLMIGIVLVTHSSNAPLTASQSRSITKPAAGGNLKRFDLSPHITGVNPAAAAKVKMLFHVLDAETGQPLAGAKIHAAYFGPGGMGEGRDSTTDNTGVGIILEPNDPTKTHGMNVFVVAEGHVPVAIGFGEGNMPADYTCKLDPAMTADGIVIDDRGRAVAGVTILIQGPGNQRGRKENVDFQLCPVTADDEGHWSCSYLPRDYTNEIRFILKKGGYAMTYPIVPVPKVDLHNLVLVIDRGFFITGRITDAKQKPIANAAVRCVSDDQSRRQSTTTDENGGFTIAGAPGEADAGYIEPALEKSKGGGMIIRGLTAQGPSRLVLAVQASGFASDVRTLDLTAGTNTANFALSPGNILRGRVVDGNGTPVAHAVVRTDYDNKTNRRQQFDWNTQTDDNGRFEWNSAPAGEICYWFAADGGGEIRGVPLLADGSDHEITLK